MSAREDRNNAPEGAVACVSAITAMVSPSV